MLNVNDLYRTLQGEGKLTGVPMVLLRLHGCGVGCPWCDTKETWVADPSQKVSTLGQALGATALYCSLAPEQILQEVKAVAGSGIKWVLITGGEPLEQDLLELVFLLKSSGFKISVETSGTVAPSSVVDLVDNVTVSPKFGMPGGRPVFPEWFDYARVNSSRVEIKQVVGRAEDIDRLLPLVQGCLVYLQPLSQSEKATGLCLGAAYKYDWRVSFQIHKYAGLR
jgi:7-carboxy-7-deazaguanine synthase